MGAFSIFTRLYVTDTMIMIVIIPGALGFFALFCPHVLLESCLTFYGLEWMSCLRLFGIRKNRRLVSSREIICMFLSTHEWKYIASRFSTIEFNVLPAWSLKRAGI